MHAHTGKAKKDAIHRTQTRVQKAQKAALEEAKKEASIATGELVVQFQQELLEEQEKEQRLQR